MTLSSSVLKELKRSFLSLVKTSGGHAKVASETRVGSSAIYNYTNRDNATCFPPLDIIYELEAHAGDYPVTRALCRAHGIIPVQMRYKGNAHDLTVSISMIAKEHADVFQKTAIAMSDGALTAKEASVILPEIAEAITALLEFEALVRDRADQCPSVLAPPAAELRPEVMA